MASTAKIAAGLGLVAVGSALAIIGPGLLAPRIDPAAAREATLAAGREAASVLRAELESMEAAVVEAAATPHLRAAIANQVDATTLVDLFATEDWWLPRRTAFPLSRVIVGSQVASFGELEIANQDRAVVTAARNGRAGASFAASQGRAVVLGAARIKGRDDVAPVLVLAAPLAEETLKKAAARTQLGLLLKAGEQTALMAAPTELRAALEGLAANRDALGDVVLRIEEGWGAAATALGPDLRLWSLRALGKPGGSGRAPIGLYVLAGVLAVAGVALAMAGVGGRGKPADSAAPGAVIPTESTIPFGTSPGRREPRASGRDTRNDLAPIPAPPPHKLTPLATAINPSEKPRTFGRYRLLDLLGVGGMSEVYTAVAHGAEGFQRTFVVKRLRPELARDKDAISQFIDEARIQSCLLHSNIVPVFDFGRMGEEYFMAQEYVIGRDLMRLSTRCIERTNFCLDPRIVYYIAHETLQALAYAHSKRDKAGAAMGIVHRDVSASNIMVTAAGDVRLFDFGIAKQTGARQAQTQAGLVKGNANFMSPEQARGKDVDARSDLFSLGMVIYYCMTGCLFYTGDNDLDVLYRAACGPSEQDLAALDQLPGPAGPILRKALAFKPEDRYQNAEEFAAAVAPYAMGMKPEAAKLMDQLFGPELFKEAAA